MIRNKIIGWVLIAVGIQMVLLKAFGFLSISWYWVLSPFYVILASVFAVFIKGFMIAWKDAKQV